MKTDCVGRPINQDHPSFTKKNAEVHNLIQKAKEAIRDDSVYAIGHVIKAIRAAGLGKTETEVLVGAVCAMYAEFPDCVFSEIPLLGRAALLEIFCGHVINEASFMLNGRFASAGDAMRYARYFPMSDAQIIGLVMAWEREHGLIYDPQWLFDAAAKMKTEAA